MPEEWPIAAYAADGIAGARAAGRDRLSTVRRDFFLDPSKRLTEQERALMTAMLHCLVGDIADALRAALPSGKVAANDEGDSALIATLTAAGLLDEPGVMALLLRRADEERISTAARARSGRRSVVGPLTAARAKIDWCTVGTAVYQVGWNSSIQSKKLGA